MSDTPLPPKKPRTTLAMAKQIIRDQRYLMNRQADLLKSAIQRNVELVDALNESEALRKKAE